MKPLKIKFHYSRLEIILNALNDYRDTMHKLTATQGVNVDDWIIKMSIAAELFFRFQAKQNKRFPSENQSLKLELHEAMILQSSLLQAKPKMLEPYSANALEKMKNELNQTLINVI